MTSPVARLLQLLELLQSAQVRTVAELSARLGVDERTVRRYVEQLRDLDIPIDSLRGRYGGYRIGAGHRMPPLVLNDAEAVVIVAGLMRALAASDSPEAAAQTALSKLRRVLPAEAARRVESLLSTTDVGAGSAQAGLDADVLLTLADAAAHRRPLRLRYRDAAEAPSQRTVHPYGLVSRAGRWYLIALDVDRREERTFRVDRIRTARQLPGVFADSFERPTHARLVAGFAEAGYRWRVVLRIRASTELIRAHLPASVATLTALPDPAWQRAEIRAAHLDWIPPVIAALDRETVVEEPDELREALAAAAARLLDAARAPR